MSSHSSTITLSLYIVENNCWNKDVIYLVIQCGLLKYVNPFRQSGVTSKSHQQDVHHFCWFGLYVDMTEE